jgi:predicted transcriptional regulator
VEGTRFCEGSTPALVLDILETHFGEWFTVVDVMWELSRLRPQLHRDTIYRAIRRVADTGLVERRVGRLSSRGGSPLLELRALSRWYL